MNRLQAAGVLTAGLLAGAAFAAAPKTNIQTRVQVTTFAIKSPSTNGWWLARASESLSFVEFRHLNSAAVITVAWSPLFTSYKTDSPEKTMQQYIERRAWEVYAGAVDRQVEQLKLIATETINGLPYQNWEMFVVHPGKDRTPTRRKLVLWARTARAAPDMFLFTLSLPEKSLEKLADYKATLRELVGQTHYEEYDFSDVALLRATIAERLFMREAERETKTHDTNKLAAARQDVLDELSFSRAVLTNSPGPWMIRGRLEEFNQEQLRYGEGFNAKGAESCYLKALELDPKHLPALEALAKLYEAVNLPAEAVRVWVEAIALQPSDTDCHYRLGRLYQRQGREADALNEFKQALRFWTGTPATKKELEAEVAALSKKLGKK